MQNKTITWLVLFFILLSLLILSIFSEKISIGDGAGWDGTYYKKICENFSNDIFNNNIDRYTLQRVFPFAIINMVVEIFNLPKTYRSI